MGKVIAMAGGGSADSDELTANRSHVLSGYTAITHDSDGEPVTGTLALTGNATDICVLAGNTYYSTDAKTKRTGTMHDHRGTPQHIDAMRNQNGRFEVAVASGYHGYSWADNSYEYMTYAEVANTAGLTASKMIKGQSCLGISGTATSDANAAAGNILSGKTAYVNGNKITGNIASMGGQTITPSASQQTVSCSGKYMTGNVIVNPCCRVYSYDSTVNVLGKNQTSSIKNISIPVNVLNGEYVFLSLYVSSLGFPRGSSDSFKINQKNPTIYTYSNQVQVYFEISADGKYITGTTLTPTSGASSSGLNRNSEICIRVTVLPYLLLYK